MGVELLQKIADVMGDVQGGGAASKQRDQIEEEGKKPEKKEKKEKNGEKPPVEKTPEEVEGRQDQANTVPATESPDGGAPAEEAPAEEVPAEGAPGEVPTGPAPITISTVIDFFQANPNPDDASVHSFAEQNGIDPHQLESMIYGLAQKSVNIFRGGKSIDTGLDPNNVDPNELQMGIETEYEHTQDLSIAKKIALDHLAEIPDYYTRLKQMEEGAMSENNAAAVPISQEPKQDGEQEETKENDPNIPPGANIRTEG